VVMLTNHYRSHPQIIGFSNNQIYQRELRLLRDPKGRRALQAGSGVHVQEVSGQTVRGPKGRSWRNPIEAAAVADLIAGLRTKEDSSLSIGVVAPFRAQVEMIIEELDKRQASRNVLVGTAHQFQGDERDIMVFSPVVARGIPENSAKWVESPPNLINVAVTRAREALFVVADLEFCSRQDGILKHMARYCRTIQSLRETSPAELELFSWMCVEGWSPDVHVPSGDIEVDFILIAPSGEKLAIEVDGDEFHDDRKEQDKARDAYLIARGFTVLRFPAREVFETPASVIHRIKVKFDAD
jgi:very-short-patch-repair endonuclease